MPSSKWPRAASGPLVRGVPRPRRPRNDSARAGRAPCHSDAASVIPPHPLSFRRQEEPRCRVPSSKWPRAASGPLARGVPRPRRPRNDSARAGRSLCYPAAFAVIPPHPLSFRRQEEPRRSAPSAKWPRAASGPLVRGVPRPRRPRNDSARAGRSISALCSSPLALLTLVMTIRTLVRQNTRFI